MGCTESREATKDDIQKNQLADRKIREDKKKDSRTVKLLLLGTGESGKSTIAKQMKIIHLKGFTQDELKAYKPIIYCNVLESILALINAASKFGFEVSEEHKPHAEHFRRHSSAITAEFTDKEAKYIKELLADQAIQKAFQRKNEFQIPDVAQYLFDNLDRISSPAYIPDEKDALKCRARTTGIVETEFTVKNLIFKIVDVGGQRSERKKWLHCFQDVMALIYCVALSEYDQTLFEEESVNRMHESIQVFENTANCRWLAPVSKIIFLNKSDIFQEKIEKKDLTCAFPEYTGGCDFLNATQFIEQKFTSKTKPPVYTHITCATDTENVRFVFNTVQEIIIKQSVEKSFGGSL